MRMGVDIMEWEMQATIRKIVGWRKTNPQKQKPLQCHHRQHIDDKDDHKQ